MTRKCLLVVGPRSVIQYHSLLAGQANCLLKFLLEKNLRL